MKEVINLNANKVDNQTIEVLEDLLSKAKTGELEALIFIDKYRDGKCGMGWAGVPDHHMIGKMDELKFDYFSQMYFPVVEE